MHNKYFIPLKNFTENVYLNNAMVVDEQATTISWTFLIRYSAHKV